MTTFVASSLLAYSFTLIVGAAGRSDPPSPQDQKAAEKKASRTDLYGDPLPSGAIARLGTIRLRKNSGGAVGSAFVANGKILATDPYGYLRFWDTATGRKLAEIEGEFHWDLIPSADGKWLAQLEGESITIREVPSGRLIRQWRASRSEFDLGRPLGFSPDGKILVEGGYGVVRLLDTGSGMEIRRLKAHDNGAHQVAFADKGRLVTAGYSQDRDEICHWDLATGKLLHQISLHVFAVRLSHDGQWLAVVDLGPNQPIRLLDAQTGKERCRLPEKEFKLPVEFSPDDRLLATIAGKDQDDTRSVAFWNPATGQLVRRFAIPAWAERGGGPDFSPDGRTLLTHGWSGLYLWDAESGKRLLDSRYTKNPSQRWFTCPTDDHFSPVARMGRREFGILPRADTCAACHFLLHKFDSWANRF